MIPKKPAPDLIRGRFSEKIMRREKSLRLCLSLAALDLL